MILGVNPLIAVGVLASTAATDAAYVFFNAAVSGRRRFWAANWSASVRLGHLAAMGRRGERGNPSQPAVNR